MPGGAAESVESVQHVDELSPEFLDLISGWDPGAANDPYYVTSADFIDLHARIKKYLIRRMIWWATSVILGMSLLFFVYR